MCTRELYNMGITLTKEEAGLVSSGKGWFPLVSGEEGLILPGFRVGRTGFGWFQLIPLLVTTPCACIHLHTQWTTRPRDMCFKLQHS